MSDASIVNAGGRTVEISRAGKVLFSEDGITKGDLADYYARVADTMLPHLQGRPLALERYPDGIDEQGFFQKNIPEYFPEWIDRVEIETGDGSVSQILSEESATLVYLADQGCITPHAWLSRTQALDFPDRLVLDLDPPEGALELVREAARATRSLLEEVGLEPFLMATGSRGFHVVAPIEPEADFDEVRRFVRDLAGLLVARKPESFTIESRKEKREGRLFLDYLRNAYGQTAVVPYGVRTRPHAPVATPVDWEELTGLDPDTYTMRNLFRRLGRKADPWRNIDDRRRSLASARQALDELLAQHNSR